MSILFPKVRQPRKWDYKPIYYDKEKEVRKEKLSHLRFRKMFEEKQKQSSTLKNKHSSHLILWIGLLLLLLLLLFFIQKF